MSENDDDYQVGRDKPPRNTQFKKGQSGNPRGRPKRSRNVKALVGKELDQPQHVRIGDKETTLSKREIWIKSMVAKAMRGDPRATAWVEARDASGQVEDPKPVEENRRRYDPVRAQQILDQLIETCEAQDRQELIETRKFLREFGIQEEVINDAVGVVGMDATEATQRHARAIKILRERGVPEDKIMVVMGRTSRLPKGPMAKKAS